MTVHVKSYTALRPVIVILSFFLCLFILPAGKAAAAEVVYSNEVTGFSAVIDDKAGLLSGSDEYYEKMTGEMKKITSCGNVAFASVDVNPYSARKYAKNLLHEFFGKESATVFLIDTDNREVYIYSYGAILKTVSQSRAYIIADNIYRSAIGSQYAECAYEGFRQENSLLEGNGIAQPMKYISSILLAFIFAGIIVYENARSHTNVTAVRTDELLKNTKYQMGIKHLTITNKSKHRIDHATSENTRSSDSSDGGGFISWLFSGDDDDSGGGFGGFGGFGGGGGGGHKF